MITLIFISHVLYLVYASTNPTQAPSKSPVPDVVTTFRDTPPDVVYDMRTAYDDNDKILATHTIKCGGEEAFDATADDGNYWFRWDTRPSVLSVEIDVIDDATEKNKWLYFIYDADKDANEGLLTISSLVEICWQCGKSDDKKIDIDLTDENFARGRYWIGADGKGEIKLDCKTEIGLTVDPGEKAIIAVALTVFALLIFTCLGIGVFSNIKWKVYDTETGDDKTEWVPLCTCSKKEETTKDAMESEMTERNVDTYNKDNNDENEHSEDNEQKNNDDEKENMRGNDSSYAEYFTIMNDVAKKEEGLDVYQILAFRLKYYAEKPAYACRFSDAQIAIFVAGVTALLQTFGISITLWSVISSYFFDESDGSIHEDAQCEWQREVWAEDGEYKILAFLWSVVISLSVAIYASSTITNGLNGLIETNKPWKELMKINQMVNVTCLQFGILVNYYTLTMAIFGSFFLIYASEGGADALDMILNAVALYFMIELDDMLVQDKAYVDLGKHTEWLKKTVGKDIECCGCQCCNCFGCCQCKVLFFKFGNIYRWVTMLLIAGASFTMPFVILACW